MDDARSKENGAPRQHAKVPIFRQAACWRVPRMGPVRTRYAPSRVRMIASHGVLSGPRIEVCRAIASLAQASPSNRIACATSIVIDRTVPVGFENFVFAPTRNVRVKTRPASDRAP